MVFAFFEKLLAVLRSSGERATVAKGTASSFLIQGGFAGLSFILATVLARWLGPSGYGAYANMIAWVSVLGSMASFGFGTILVRDVAIWKKQQNWGKLRGLLKFSNGFILLISFFLMAFACLVAQILFTGDDKVSLRNALWMGSLLIPLVAIAVLRQSAIRGLNDITKALLPDVIFRPTIILAGVLLLRYFFPDALETRIVIGISIASSLFTVWLSSKWLTNLLPGHFKQVEPEYFIQDWLKSAFPMLVYSSLQLLISQTPIVLLGVFGSDQDVGFFSVAYRLSYLLTFFLGAVQMASAPKMAQLYASNEKEKLQKLLFLMSRISFLITFISGVALFMFRDFVLGIFGNAYLMAGSALGILILSNCVDIAFGSPSLLLAMTGHEKNVALMFIGISVINILINFFLIPAYGFNGAAISTLVILIVSRLIMAAYTWKELGLNTTIFPSISL